MYYFNIKYILIENKFNNLKLPKNSKYILLINKNIPVHIIHKFLNSKQYNDQLFNSSNYFKDKIPRCNLDNFPKYCHIINKKESIKNIFQINKQIMKNTPHKHSILVGDSS